ncbi:MAG: hypothetical protein Q8M03_16925 [Legionella sp.]|nr:hypothetical protein [Legionella sp.]
MTWSKTTETLKKAGQSLKDVVTTDAKSTPKHRYIQLGNMVLQNAESTVVVGAPQVVAIATIIAASFVEFASSVYSLFFKDIKPSEMFVEGLEAVFALLKGIFAIILYFQGEECDGKKNPSLCKVLFLFLILYSATVTLSVIQTQLSKEKKPATDPEVTPVSEDTAHVSEDDLENGNSGLNQPPTPVNAALAARGGNPDLDDEIEEEYRNALGV